MLFAALMHPASKGRLGNGKFVFDAACQRSAEIIAKRGYTPVLVPYQSNWYTFHSGIHCSTCRIWSE